MYDPHLWNFDLAPNWRIEVVKELDDPDGFVPPAQKEDPYVRIYRQYLDAKAKSHTKKEKFSVESRWPGIWYAEKLWGMQQKTWKWETEARILGRQPLDQIANQVMTQSETLAWYIRLYFDVVDKLQHDSYIVQKILGPNAMTGLKEREYDVLWKLIGLRLGPVGLDHFIKHFADARVYVSTPRELKAAYEDACRASMARKSWLAMETMPVSYNQVNILQCYNEMLNIERQSGSGKEGQTQLALNISQAVIALPLYSGDTGLRPPQVATQRLIPYDGQGVELRDRDMLAVALGNEPQSVRDLMTIKFPEREARDGPNDKRDPG